jgi:hypothetical protein
LIVGVVKDFSHWIDMTDDATFFVLGENARAKLREGAAFIVSPRDERLCFRQEYVGAGQYTKRRLARRKLGV